MGAGKNKAHKKKRISKHVLQAQERKQEEEQQDASSTANNDITDNNSDPKAATNPQQNATKKKKRKQKKNKQIKDPKEGHNYLSAWKHRESAPGVWKFNKNTQSWLFRHIYDVEKMPKATFSLLIEYLKDLKGESRERVKAEAVQKAMRYKAWEKNKPNGDDSKAESSAGDGASASNKDDGKKEGVDDETAFNALNDHDKRKEYKRARKMIDVLKASTAEIES